MRYESIPRKIGNTLSAIYKRMYQEFGKWSFLIIAFLLYVVHKPVLRFLDKASTVLIIGGLAVIGLWFLWFFIKKMFRRY